jgi:hypothetical protein
MLRRLIVFIILLASLLPLGVRAQEQGALTAVEVELWPEFDHPSMLVIYRITLSPAATLPVEVRLRIPVAAGAPNAVAAKHPDGSLYTLNYTSQDVGAWTQLVFQATTPELQVEYYDPGLVKDGATRHFEYQWPGDYSAESFTIRVQQPKGASQMSFSPSLGTGSQAADGMIYYTSQVGPLALGQSFTIRIDYQKETDALSVESVPISASGPLDDTASGRWTISSALPFFLGGIGLLLILGGAYWYWQSGREKEQSTPKKRGARRKSGARGDVAVGEGGHVYCHQCGKRASPGDRFCRACGTQLRI